MNDIKQVQTAIRTSCVPSLIGTLKDHGVSRLFAWHAHALGATVDP